MSFKNWNERQIQWQKERELDFNESSKFNAFRGLVTSTNNDRVNYFISKVFIKDNTYHFTSFPDSYLSLTLLRNTTYIFDLSDSSNLNHRLIISRVPSIGKIKDLIYQGTPGTIGSFVSFYIGEGRPKKLYYYDEYLKGVGGKINILD